MEFWIIGAAGEENQSQEPIEASSSLIAYDFEWTPLILASNFPVFFARHFVGSETSVSLRCILSLDLPRRGRCLRCSCGTAECPAASAYFAELGAAYLIAILSVLPLSLMLQINRISARTSLSLNKRALSPVTWHSASQKLHSSG